MCKHQALHFDDFVFRVSTHKVIWPLILWSQDVTWQIKIFQLYYHKAYKYQIWQSDDFAEELKLTNLNISLNI